LPFRPREVRYSRFYVSREEGIPMTEHPGRDSGGRFTSGNPGRPPGAKNRTTTRISRLIAADFVRHHQLFLEALRQRHPERYLDLALQMIDQADPAPAADNDPPLDIDALAEESQARVDAETHARAERRRGLFDRNLR
jgi:hypothetical protein